MSRPNQVRVMLVLAFLLTLVAGAVVGAALMRSTQIAAVPPTNATVTTPPTVTSPATTQSAQSHSSRDWFASRLSLTSVQQEEWTKIWSASPHERFKQIGQQERASYQKRDESISVLYTTEQRDDRERIEREYRGKIWKLMGERDKAIAALYTPEQKAERDRLEKECAAEVAKLRNEREKLLQPMVNQSRAILSEDQRKKFDSMLRGPGPGTMGQGSNMGGPGHRSSPSGNSNSGRNRGPSTQPSQPSQQSQQLSPTTRPVSAPNSLPPGDVR
jgi:hypothetical protein